MELLIGFEKEFYTNALLDKAQLDAINEEISCVQAKLVKERGKLQYEMVCFPQKALLKSFDKALFELYQLNNSYSINDISSFTEATVNSIVKLYKKQLFNLRSKLSDMGFAFDDSAKPYPDDYGSALQLSFSVDNFSKDDYCNAVYCILSHCKGFHHKMNVNSGFERFKVPGFMSPTHICWGGNNNRTTLIRALNIDSADKNEKKKNVRIEYRGANSNADVVCLVKFILQMVLFSQAKKYPTYPKIWVNAYDKQYNLEEL